MADVLSSFNPLAAVISRVQIRSAFTPPVVYTADDLWNATRGSGSGSGGWLSARVKPTLIVEGPLVNRTIAPYGIADPDEWRANTTSLAVLAASSGLLVFALGALAGRWAAKRKG